MTIAVVPGSFDPVTLGHLDLIWRAVGLFDQVVVAVATNSAKRAQFAPAQRADLIRTALAQDPQFARAPSGQRVRVEVVTGLIASYCRDIGASAIVKGIRGGADLDYEVPMALLNREIADIETIFVLGDPNLAHISSSAVKELARLGGEVTALVPPVVGHALAEMASQN